MNADRATNILTVTLRLFGDPMKPDFIGRKAYRLEDDPLQWRGRMLSTVFSFRVAWKDHTGIWLRGASPCVDTEFVWYGSCGSVTLPAWTSLPAELSEDGPFVDAWLQRVAERLEVRSRLVRAWEIASARVAT